jgi:hypothetical protein
MSGQETLRCSTFVSVSGLGECDDHGIPSKPSLLAYDHQLGLLAVGTRTAAVKI